MKGVRQDQTPYRAEFEAVLLVCKCLLDLTREGALARVRKIVIVLDCLSVISSASGVCQASPLLARRFANISELRVSLIWSLGAQPWQTIREFAPHQCIGEALMLAWSHRADTVASDALRARLHGCRRALWWRDRQRAAEWEVQAIGALCASGAAYREFAARL